MATYLIEYPVPKYEIVYFEFFTLFQISTLYILGMIVINCIYSVVIYIKF